MNSTVAHALSEAFSPQPAFRQLAIISPRTSTSLYAARASCARSARRRATAHPAPTPSPGKGRTNLLLLPTPEQAATVGDLPLVPLDLTLRGDNLIERGIRDPAAGEIREVGARPAVHGGVGGAGHNRWSEALPKPYGFPATSLLHTCIMARIVGKVAAYPGFVKGARFSGVADEFDSKGDSEEKFRPALIAAEEVWRCPICVTQFWR